MLKKIFQKMFFSISSLFRFFCAPKLNCSIRQKELPELKNHKKHEFGNLWGTGTSIYVRYHFLTRLDC